MSKYTDDRKIIHVDMDAFYASVEQRDDPNLRGRPIVVGGDPKSRGVVCSASYEARKFGVKSAMSCAQAYRLCPQAVFVFPHFQKYVEASRAIRSIFEKVTPMVEPLSLDEAFLDVTVNHFNEPLASKLALWIKDEIKRELNLTASAGVGPNKFIAKLASDFKKPDGLVIVPPEKVFEFIEHLPVERFWGVGPATAKKLHMVGLKTAKHIREYPEADLERILGSYGSFLFDLAHGEDRRIVDPSFDPKSRGTEVTLKRDTLDPHFLLSFLESQAEEVSQDLKKLRRLSRTVTLKIKYSDFSRITRSQTLLNPTDDPSTIYQTASSLLFKDTQVGHKYVRLIGISAGNLLTEDEPMQLWFNFPGY